MRMHVLCVRVFMYMCLCLCGCVCIHLCKCVCVCVCVCAISSTYLPHHRLILLLSFFSHRYLSKEEPTGWPLKTSVYQIFRFHFGTLAFGSMIVAIIQMIRAVLEFVEHQAKRGEVSDSLSCMRKWIFNCVRCLMICLEKCVKFISKK